LPINECVCKKIFDKDIETITDKKLAGQLSVAIFKMEKCKKLSGLSHLKHAGSRELL